MSCSLVHLFGKIDQDKLVNLDGYYLLTLLEKIVQEINLLKMFRYVCLHERFKFS